MRVIFLDIDGVLNCKNTTQRSRGFIGIDPFLVAIFNKIIFATDAEIILSSAWRLFNDSGKEEIRRAVMPFISETPRPTTGFRGDEIREWFKLNPNIQIEKYAILDDDSDFYPDQPLFKTSWETGLTEEIANNLIQYLCQKN
jgi:hypothetical protein